MFAAQSLKPAIAQVVPLRHAEGQPTVAQLVEAGLHGDPFALRELYDRHAKAVLARALRLLGRSADAEDVTQEAFLEAFRDLKQLQAPERFGAFLMGILTHRIYRRFRRQRLLSRLGFLEKGERDASLEKLGAGAGQETLLQLSRADTVLRTIAPELRLAWMLRMVEGCELAEVAALGHCSLATAKRRVARAHERVRAVLDMDLPAGDPA
ncbi:MAG: RNA polymerase sigma factor [Polyangiaceae bacterium]|nr:RNA polymerase sigma factor [Polyangiaceae bacterium]